MVLYEWSWVTLVLERLKIWKWSLKWHDLTARASDETKTGKCFQRRYNVDHLHRLVLILNLLSLQRKDMQVKKHSGCYTKRHKGVLHKRTQQSPRKPKSILPLSTTFNVRMLLLNWFNPTLRKLSLKWFISGGEQIWERQALIVGRSVMWIFASLELSLWEEERYFEACLETF